MGARGLFVQLGPYHSVYMLHGNQNDWFQLMVSRNIIGFETFALSPQISDKKYGNMHIMVWCPESLHFFLISRDPVTSTYFQKPMFVLKP